MAGMTARQPMPDKQSLASRAMLMAVLWLGFWLLAAGLAIGLLAIPFAQIHYRNTVDLSGILAACAGLTLAYSLRPRRADKASADVVPTALQREEAPQLFDFIEGVAAKLGVQAPFEIHLVTTATAFISAQRSWSGRVRKLSIGIGMPLFAWLSEAELGAVIAHEFGHFVGGDTSLTPWVYRTRSSIGAAIHALDDSVFFLDEPFRRYGHWFLRLSSAVSRAQEYSADALSAQYFGATAACAALEKVHLLEPMWFAYFHHDLVPALNCGGRVPVFEGYRRFCAASPRRREVQEAIDHAEDRTASPYDTHPSLEERLAALGISGSGRLPRPANCAGLLGGEERIEAMWYQRIGGSDWPATGWDAFGDAILRARMQQRFAGTNMAPENMPLTRLPDIARSLGEWWTRLRPDGPSFLSPEGQRKYVLNVLREWIIASLCQAGFSLKVRPGGSMVLERDGVTLEPGELLAAACEGRLFASDIARYVAEPGVDPAAAS
jgi:Zn-dependent protease with chaperone function